MFDEFQYCINLGANYTNQQPNINSKKFVSLIINQSTNILLVAERLCQKNNLIKDLVPILVESIQIEIQQQIEQYHKKIKQKSKYNVKEVQNSNKSKKFKNKFCKYLNQMSKEDVNVQDTFENSFQTIKNQEYSFRPAYMKILDLADKEGHLYDEKITIKQPLERNLSINKKYSRNVFQDLYSEHRILSIKKQFKRKQSIQKLTFRPQINKMSKKIIQMKKNFCNNENIELKKSHQNESFSSAKHNKKSNLIIKSKIIENQISELQGERKPLLQLNIYQRGELYLQKSSEKRQFLSKIQMLKQLQKCTFKPILSRSKSKSRINLN